MAGQERDLRPIQVFLDASGFIELPEPQPMPRATKDFFAGNDRGFAQHKKRIKAQVAGLADGMRRKRQRGAFVKVRQREEALAKSYRPLSSLFSRSNRFAFVGAEHAGELLFQATPDALDRLARLIETKAEATPRMVTNKRTGKLEPRVSGYRSELGGLDDVQLYLPADKFTFSAEEAVRWMREPNAIGGYIVELFRPDPEVGAPDVNQMVAGLRRSLEGLSGGLLVRPFLPGSADANAGQPAAALSVQLTTGSRRLIEMPFDDNGRALLIHEAGLPREMRGARADLSVTRHAELLHVLAEQALVRSVELPPILETTPASGGTSLGPWEVPRPVKDVDYPVVAIVDGGVSEALAVWKIGDAGLVPAGDRNCARATWLMALRSTTVMLITAARGSLSA